MKEFLFALLFLLTAAAVVFGETEWELSRQRSRSTAFFGSGDCRLSVAVDSNGAQQPLSAQWSFSSPLFRAGGITRSGFVSFFDNRNLSSDGKRNGISDTWGTSRTSSLTGIGAFGIGGAGLYAAHHRDYLLTGISLRKEVTDRVSFVNAVEWWEGAAPSPSTDWYYRESASRESSLLKSVHGMRFKLRSGHDAAVYASASAGNLNPASAALLFLYEYKSPLREFLLKSAWYGNDYLFRLQKPADRTAAFFVSYRENFEKKGFIRVHVSFDLPPIPDMFYILPFELTAALKGEFRHRGWRLTAENRRLLNGDKEGNGILKNRAAASLSWQGMSRTKAAVGATISARYTYDTTAADDWKTEARLLVIYRRQSFALKTAVEDGPIYSCGAETVFRLPDCEIKLAPQWKWSKNGGKSDFKATVGF